jgi:hypothetical protein
MSIGNKFVDWCRVPPEPPQRKYRKLLASGLIFTILSVSVFACLGTFYGPLMVGPSSALSGSSALLTVANLAEGPAYIQNVTYQPVAEANNLTVQNYEQTMQWLKDNPSRVLSFGEGSTYGSSDSGSTNSTIINFGDADLTVTSIEIYQGNSLFAVINGNFTVKAHAIGIVDFQMHNCTALSKWEAQQLTNTTGKDGESNETTSYWPYDWRPVTYTAIVKTSAGLTATFETLVFPTVPDSSFMFDSDGNYLGWPVEPSSRS